MKTQAKIIILTGIISGIAVPHSFGASGFDIFDIKAEYARKKANLDSCFEKIHELDKQFTNLALSNMKKLRDVTTTEEREKLQKELYDTLEEVKKEKNNLLSQYGLDSPEDILTDSSSSVSIEPSETRTFSSIDLRGTTQYLDLSDDREEVSIFSSRASTYKDVTVIDLTRNTTFLSMYFSNFPNLKHLILTENTTILSMSLSGLDKLETLDLRGNKNFDGFSIRCLQSSRPNLKIIQD